MYVSQTKLQLLLVGLLIKAVTCQDDFELCEDTDGQAASCNILEENPNKDPYKNSLGFHEHFDLTRYDRMVLIKGKKLQIFFQERNYLKKEFFLQNLKVEFSQWEQMCQSLYLTVRLRPAE